LKSGPLGLCSRFPVWNLVCGEMMGLERGPKIRGRGGSWGGGQRDFIWARRDEAGLV